MWYQKGQHPCALPSSAVTADNLTLTNLNTYSEERLNELGWFKCPSIKSYDHFYYYHEWQEPEWVYQVKPFENRKAKIESKKTQYINLLRSWYREVRYETLVDAPIDPKMLVYMSELQGEVNRLGSLIYQDAGIDTELSELDSFDVVVKKDTELNAEALEFWYNYNNNSMPVKQRGGFGLIG